MEFEDMADNISVMYEIIQKLRSAGVIVEVDDYSKYRWYCYPDAYTLTITPNTTKAVSFDVVFDPATGKVYEASAHDTWLQEYSRWIDPDYVPAFYSECFERQVEPNVADPDNGVEFTKADDIEEVWSDFEGLFRDAGRATRPRSGSNEESETLTLDLSNDELAMIALAAHQKDMKLNDFINEAVRVKLQEMEESGLFADLLTEGVR